MFDMREEMVMHKKEVGHAHNNNLASVVCENCAHITSKHTNMRTKLAMLHSWMNDFNIVRENELVTVLCHTGIKNPAQLT